MGKRANSVGRNARNAWKLRYEIIRAVGFCSSCGVVRSRDVRVEVWKRYSRLFWMTTVWKTTLGLALTQLHLDDGFYRF